MGRVIALLVITLSFATPLFALGATIDPSASDLTVVPGERAVATISVKNDANSLKNYEISIFEAKFGKTADDVSFAALSSDLKTAIVASPRTFVLEGNASRTIDVLVDLPVGVDAQSPTVAIFVTEKGDSTTAGSVQSAIASMLFIHVPGRLASSMAIDSFVAIPAFTFGSTTTLSALFRNDGEDTLVLPNEVRVYGPFGREVGRGELSIAPKHLPPGTSRGLSVSWPTGTSFSKFLFGPYRFELWDGDKKLAQTSVTFLPPIIIGAVIIFLVVLLGIIKLVRVRK